MAGTHRLHEILEYNRRFVADQAYEPYRTSRYPNKKLVILSCMDTRLSELLPRAMNVGNGDAKFVKNAGAIVSHPFGSIMRSILVAVYELGAEDVCVVGHHDCGMVSIDPDRMIRRMTERGVAPAAVQALIHAGIDLHAWLQRIESVQESVRRSVGIIHHHPLMPAEVSVHGLVVDPETGKLDLVVDGDAADEGA